MNQKKCPKCGEMNPAEAVMCWACYTPLSSGAVAAGAGVAGVGALAQPHAVTPDGDEEGKKAIAPWQMGVVAVALLLGLGFGAKTLMGGSDNTDPGAANNLDKSAVIFDPGKPGTTTSVAPPPPSSGPTNNTTVGETGPQTPAFIPFNVASPPNAQLAWGIMAIVPTKAATPQSAAALAIFAARQFRQNSSWKGMHVYVFQDAQSAKAFSQYQISRHQDVLGPGDYAQLAAIWPSCLARYEYNGGKESYKYPSRSPGSWWR